MGARQQQLIEELRAENELLRNEQATWEHTNRWQASEIERLRAALEKIEAGYGQRLSAAEIASMARQALR